MENDEYKYEINTINSRELNLDNIFKIDYASQKLDNNIEFQKWKKSMLIKYGKDAKLFRCIEDNILFYITYKDCRKKPSFGGKCPICKNQICLFCSYNFKGKYEWENKCCIKRNIYKLIFYDGLRYIFEIDKNDTSYEENIVIFEFFPGISLFEFIGKIFCILYLDLPIKKSLRNNRKYDTYRDEIERGNFYLIIMIMLIAINIILCIPFLIYNIFSLILIVIISIPFKFYPLKFFHGLIYGF